MGTTKRHIQQVESRGLRASAFAGRNGHKKSQASKTLSRARSTYEEDGVPERGCGGKWVYHCDSLKRYSVDCIILSFPRNSLKPKPGLAQGR